MNTQKENQISKFESFYSISLTIFALIPVKNYQYIIN